MSVWEQRANQLRRQNRASCEALYNELQPEERIRLTSALNIRPDMKTHLDRPLVVETCDGALLGSQHHHHHKTCTAEEAETAADLPPAPHHPRHHHRHRARIKEDINDNGEAGREGRRHVHHSRSKEHDCSRSKEGGRMNHHQSSVEDGGGGVKSERAHRHHHSHRQSRGGNGTVNSEGKGERRSRHKDGRPSHKTGDRSSRGDNGEHGGKSRHHAHRSRSRCTTEEANERKNHNHRYTNLILCFDLEKHSLRPSPENVVPWFINCQLYFNLSCSILKCRTLDLEEMARHPHNKFFLD